MSFTATGGARDNHFGGSLFGTVLPGDGADAGLAGLKTRDLPILDRSDGRIFAFPPHIRRSLGRLNVDDEPAFLAHLQFHGTGLERYGSHVQILNGLFGGGTLGAVRTAAGSHHHE